MRKLIFFILPLLVFFAGCNDANVSIINIYHTSGTGGMYWARTEPFFENQEVGGLAVLKNFYNKEQGKKILLDGGDWFSRSQEGALGGMGKALELMSMTGYNASGISYADLSGGWATISQQLKNARFSLLSSNLKTTANKVPLPFKAHVIRDVGGVKLGIFSLVIKNSVSGPHSRLTDINITDEIEAAKEQVEALKDAGADIIILLADIAENEDNYDEASIVEEVEGIDIVLGSAVGSNESEIIEFKNTHIVRTEPYLTSVSKIRLAVGEDKKIVSLHFESMPLYKDRYGEDAEIKKLVDDLRSTTHRRLNHVVAQSTKSFKDIDNAPSQLGEIVADCMKTWAKVDFAIINSDSLRANLEEGSITDYNLYEIYPYMDTIMTVRVRGGEIKNLLEKSLMSKNNFPQVAGIEITYDKSAPAGNKIKKIKLKGSEPGRNTIYRLATTDHIIAGGFGHDDFVNVVEFKNTKVDMRSVLRSCFSRKKKITAPSSKFWIEAK